MTNEPKIDLGDDKDRKEFLTTAATTTFGVWALQAIVGWISVQIFARAWNKLKSWWIGKIEHSNETTQQDKTKET